MRYAAGCAGAPGHFPPLPDDSLRGATLGEWNFEEDDGREWGLVFYPFGSGRGDITIRGANDMELMSAGVCRPLGAQFGGPPCAL